LQQALKDNPRTALEKINIATNRFVPYKSDTEIYNQSDYWSTPVKTLLHGGDCEDFALLNAVALTLNGWPADKMRILIGYAVMEGRRQPHAALLVETAQGRFILNNMNNRVAGFAESGIEIVYMIDSRGAITFPETHSALINPVAASTSGRQ
jgi:predicted transglutaminase-like cysteine proteinase